MSTREPQPKPEGIVKPKPPPAPPKVEWNTIGGTHHSVIVMDHDGDCVYVDCIVHKKVCICDISH